MAELVLRRVDPGAARLTRVTMQQRGLDGPVLGVSDWMRAVSEHILQRVRIAPRGVV